MISMILKQTSEMSIEDFPSSKYTLSYDHQHEYVEI